MKSNGTGGRRPAWIGAASRERDICTKFSPPALGEAGWDEMSQIREKVSFTQGRIKVCGKLVTRGWAKTRRLHSLLQAQHPDCADRSEGQFPQRR